MIPKDPEANSPDFKLEPPPLNKKFDIRVIGVGGAGGNAVNHLARERFEGVTFTALNTDAAALAQLRLERAFILGAKTTRGLGSGGDPERGRTAAEEDLTRIRELCQGADLVFVVAGLGGGTGTGAGPVVARVAKECGALVLGIVILPFDCEGNRRARQAQLGLFEFKKAADGVICLPNQTVFKIIDEKTSLVDAFAITNEYVAQGVRGIWRLLAKPGLINADFADLCAVTQGRHTEGVLVTAEACGESRVREVLAKLLAHPLIEEGRAFTDAAGLLVSIAGGPGLTMTEVNRIMEQLNRHCDQAFIVLGASVEEAMGDRLTVTVVAGRKHSGLPFGENNHRMVQAPKNEGEEEEVTGLDRQLLDSAASHRPPPRFVAPPPPTTPDRTQQLLGAAGGRYRKSTPRLRQGQLPLEIVAKGRFEKSEPTIHQGQDLDVPTYIRRGVALN